ncbi:hypothetical protein HK405_007732 [Cladochytrium tenue]|nr:hypothetical protein HK405_007732 [Cladochytrium tenue]
MDGRWFRGGALADAWANRAAENSAGGAGGRGGGESSLSVGQWIGPTALPPPPPPASSPRHRPPPSVYNSFLDDRPFWLLSEAECRAHRRAHEIRAEVPAEVIQQILFGLVLQDSWNDPQKAYSSESGGYHFTTFAPATDAAHATTPAEGADLLQAAVFAAAAYQRDPTRFLDENKHLHQCSRIVVRRMPPKDAEGADEEEPYIIGLRPPGSAGGLLGGGRAILAFRGTSSLAHVRQALKFFPAKTPSGGAVGAGGGGVSPSGSGVAGSAPPAPGVSAIAAAAEQAALTVADGSGGGVPASGVGAEHVEVGDEVAGFHSGYFRVAAGLPDLVGALQRAGYNDVVICGHSRGGAVAQLVTVLYLLRDRGTTDADGASASASPRYGRGGGVFARGVRCYAFGSPFVVTEEVAQVLNDRGLHSRFISVVNDGDAVPGVMSTVGGMSPEDLMSIGTRTFGPGVSNVIERLGLLLASAIGLTSIGLIADVASLLWKTFFDMVIKHPANSYRPIGL